MYQVVIVEDDPMVSLLDRTFTEKDPRFQVVQTFSDGQSALAWLCHNPVDLLILDVYMPICTGLELLRELRAREVETDAIMVTAANDTKTVDALLKLGVVDYLVKPFVYERFQQALDTFCRHRQAIAGDAVSQNALDHLFPGTASDHQPPKGVQESTLERIRACLHAAPQQGLPSDALSQRTGLSAVTVRHYVNYLVEQGEIISTVNYDTGGRPCRLYRYPRPLNQCAPGVFQARIVNCDFFSDET